MPRQKNRLATMLISLACTLPLAAQATTQPHKHANPAHQNNEAAIPPGFAPYQEEYDKLKAEANGYARQISEITGRTDVSPEGLHHAAAQLDDQMFSLQLEQAGTQARRDAILQEIDKLSRATTQASKHDPVSQELEKVVEVRQRYLERTKELRQSAAVSESDVQSAVAQVAEAAARLASQKEQAAFAAGGETIVALRKQLVDLTIAEQDQGARLAFIKGVREKLAKGMELLDPMQSILSRAEDVHSLLRNLEMAMPLGESQP